MFQPTFTKLAILGAILWAISGCVSIAPDPEDLTPVLPNSRSQLETAPPAARDELEEALGWIAEDAPRTEVSAEEDAPDPGAQR